MQVPGSDNAGPGRDILGLELMSEGIETLLEPKKANGIMFGCNFILSEIFISKWTLSLRMVATIQMMITHHSTAIPQKVTHHSQEGQPPSLGWLSLFSGQSSHLLDLEFD